MLSVAVATGASYSAELRCDECISDFVDDVTFSEHEPYSAFCVCLWLSSGSNYLDLAARLINV